MASNRRNPRIEQLEREKALLEQEVERLRKDYLDVVVQRNERPTTYEVQDLRAQVLVLQSDRDRLTAALETCTRRLASPAAESDVTRAGWRYANLAAIEKFSKPAIQ